MFGLMLWLLAQGKLQTSRQMYMERCLNAKDGPTSTGTAGSIESAARKPQPRNRRDRKCRVASDLGLLG